VIAGESGFTDSYVASLRALGSLDPRVIFVGLQKRPAVHQLLHHAAAFASPSTLEGLPMSLLECMQHATPAVVSDIPPHRELLGRVDGYDLFFPPTNIDAFQTQLRKTLAAQDEYRRVAEESKAMVLKRHSWVQIAEQTETVLYDVVDRTPRSSRTRWPNREMLPTAEELNRRI
jgi:glycosyltransferase involved in cell wall biosynthesis